MFCKKGFCPSGGFGALFPFENTAFSFNFDIAPQISDCMIVTLLLTSDFNACVVSNEGTNNC